MTGTQLRIAHHFAPAVGASLGTHPAVAEARTIDLANRWDFPTDVDVIFAPPDSSDVGTHAPRPAGWPGSVRFVQLASSGIDGYPAWLFDGPIVATSAGTSAPAIAEFVLATMLVHEKRLPEVIVRDGTPWPSQAALLQRPLGSLDGKTLGLLGVGHIGSRIATLANAFGMTVIAHRRSTAASPDPAFTVVPFDQLLARADHLVIAAPLSPETTGLIGADALRQVRRGVHIVNIARGAIIDNAALIAALEDGRVGAASLDVTAPEPLPPGDPLWTAPNIHITPHIAWSSAATPRRVFTLFVQNLERFAAGERLINQV